MKIQNKIGPILSGTEMSLPVNLISELAHLANYGTDISNPSILINSLLAYNIYKFDRYADAQADTTTLKTEFYDNLLDNKKIIEFLIFSSSISILTLLVHYDMKSIIPMYMSTFMYKSIKKINVPIKPFYVAGMWSISTCVVPEYPIYDINVMLPIFLNIFALTNLADIKDASDDKINNVTTIPNTFGKHFTLNLCVACSILSCALYSQLDYFSFSAWDNIFLASNLIPYLNFTL